MRPEYMGLLFMCSGLVSFNAGIWQIYRRGQKRQLLENHKNMDKPPLHSLPPSGSKMDDYEFHPVALKGTFDNEGSVLVGPRGLSSYRGAANSDESRGGFVVISPFQIANSQDFVMVNRGWVPIEAGKHRTMLAQFIGQGFSPSQTIYGIIRKEEFLKGSIFRSDDPDNKGPVAADLSWLVIRPWNMAQTYYRRRWGGEKLDDSVKTHGAHHYYIEMVEDFSGNDQRLVRGHAWPRRREPDEITYVHLTPIVHSMYVVFWFSVTLGSMYGLSKCWRRQKELFMLRRRTTEFSTRLEAERQKEAKAYFQAVQDVERLQKLDKTAGAAAAAQLGTTAPKKPSDTAAPAKDAAKDEEAPPKQ